MKTKFLGLMLASVLSVLLLSNWTQVQAQSPTNPDDSPVLVDIPFNANTDGSIYIPDDIETSDDPSGGIRGIIGIDNRIPLLQQVFPWSTIGRLYWILGDGREIGYCTGNLIGRDVILTNSHCLTHPVTEQVVNQQTYRSSQDKLVFVPNRIGENFVRKDVALITDDFRYGWQTNPDDSSEDWALLRLNKPLGDKYGYLGWRTLDLTNQSILNAAQGAVNLAGYSGDYPNAQVRKQLNLSGREGETAGLHRQCSINAEVSGVILHDCDTMGGASGSSLLAKFTDGNYYIVGLHRGSLELSPENLPASFRETCQVYDQTGGVVTIPACRNVAVPVSRWAALAAAMRNSSL